MSASRLSVRFVDKKESCIALARGFIDPLYLKTYGTTPPLSDAYTVIEMDGAVRACLGVDWPDKDGFLGIERVYSIKAANYPRTMPAASKLQLNRWASTLPEAAALVVLAASIYALAKGRLYALVEHNKAVHRRAERLGIPFIDISHEPANLDLIRPENRQYYAKRDMKPYLMDLEEAKKALEKKVPPYDLEAI